MSISIMSAVWKNGPSNSTERFVLLALADYANDAGQGINPAFATIAKKCAISRRTAIRAVDSLIEQGYLARSLRMKDKEFTSSEYTIIIAKLGIGDDSKVTMRSDRKSLPSDNTSLRIVTMTLPSDTMTLGSVVDDTTPSDTVSPNPSFLSINEPSLNQGEKNAREATPKKSPPSPIVKQHISDRTPGGNGYHPPDEPEPVKREPSPEGLAVGDMANAISEVTGMSAKLLRDEVGGFAMELLDAGYTAAQLRTHYTKQRIAGAWNWYDEDWRGKKGDRPRIKEIRETIAGATYKAAAPKKLSQIDLALAMLKGPQPATG
jgi:hypothetical protein